MHILQLQVMPSQVFITFLNVSRPKSLEGIFLQIENNEELEHDTINLYQSILKEQNIMAGFEDTGLTCHQFI